MHIVETRCCGVDVGASIKRKITRDPLGSRGNVRSAEVRAQLCRKDAVYRVIAGGKAGNTTRYTAIEREAIDRIASTAAPGLSLSPPSGIGRGLNPPGCARSGHRNPYFVSPRFSD